MRRLLWTSGNRIDGMWLRPDAASQLTRILPPGLHLPAATSHVVFSGQQCTLSEQHTAFGNGQQPTCEPPAGQHVSPDWHEFGPHCDMTHAACAQSNIRPSFNHKLQKDFKGHNYVYSSILSDSRLMSPMATLRPFSACPIFIPPSQN
jgi:hypothetical protein